MRTRDLFTTVRTEGGLLPADLLQRIAAGDSDLEGLRPSDYHLAGTERLNEAISRAWNRLLGAWTAFRAAAEKLPQGDLSTSPTRERWLLILFQELGYGRLSAARAVEIEGKAYPISHFWQNSPIHLVGFRVDLDRRTRGVAGAARTSPHSLVQEFLNRSDDHLWGFVSNGLRLRILRDNVSLTRQSYVEFDLEGMMDGEVYADFALLWLLCHESRVEGERPEQCWLERWVRIAQQQGTRALEHLRDGVTKAINSLGSGFLAHPHNTGLREKLRSGQLDKQDYFRQLLRLVYRIIFLFAAEDRGLLLDPNADPAARRRYQRFYSTARLRRLAEKRRGTKHADLYQGLCVVMERLGSDAGCPELALPALGSFLWSDQAIPDLTGADIANHDLLDAVRALAFTVEEKVFRVIDYKNMGAEELGSVYESLLEMHPELNAEVAAFDLKVAPGHERKTTGSYYTPASLVNCLLDSALDPVVDKAVKKDDPEQAILNLKICDPACGSGHFLLSAAHRIAKRLAAIRTGDEEPAPEVLRQALRDCIGHCIYGVDINPMAVELCKVSLWMEAMEPGKPLTFLDHHIRCGNSLLGATPALLANGIPDEAFKPITGDDKAYCRELKKQNKSERKDFEQGQAALFYPWERLGDLATAMVDLDEMPDDTPQAVRAKQERYEQFVKSTGYLFGHLWADAWCAAFVWRKVPERDGGPPYAITEEIFRATEKSPHSVPQWMKDEVRRLARQYQFFHWHLEFPDVFRVPAADEKPENEQTGWSGGFDVVLGNPPWERIKLQEKEFFAARAPEIAEAPNAAARRRMIAKLAETNPALHNEFKEALRRAEGESRLVRDTGRYPLCGRGDVNTYSIFAELKRSLLNPRGRVGCIVPSGIATDDTTKFFFQDLMDAGSLVSLYDFENRSKIFPAVDSRMKFCLLTMATAGGRAARATDFVFFAHDVADLAEQDRHFTLTAEEIALLNPNTRTCPIFRSRADAELTKAIYRRVPVLIKEARDDRPEENSWGISFLRMFDMTNDSHLFRTKEQLEAAGGRLEGNIFHVPEPGTETVSPGIWLPLYEAKMTQPWDHRAADVRVSSTAVHRKAQPYVVSMDEKRDPYRLVKPLFWVSEADTSSAIPQGFCYQWTIGFTNVTSPTNERTFLPTIIPKTPVGNSMPLMVFRDIGPLEAILSANLSSFVFDFQVRQKIGGVNLNFYLVNQFPVASRSQLQSIQQVALPLVLELTFTAWDLEPFARDCGYDGPPFVWDDERRFLIRCELDAVFFRLYLPSAANGEWRMVIREEGAVVDETPEQLAELKKYFPTPRDAVAYIMETFPIVKRKDEQKYGEYRTKDTILEIYDEMQAVMAENAAAVAAGRQPTARYQTRLDPLPGPPCDEQGNFIPMRQWDRAHWPPHIHRPKGAVVEVPEEVPIAEPAVAVSRRRRASNQFQQAAVITWIVGQLSSEEYPSVTRYRVTKFAYLLERKLSLGLFTEFQKKAAGPYDPSIRYKGPEDIAVNRHHWIQSAGQDRFKPGTNIAKGLEYATRYIDVKASAKILEEFRTYKDETLGRWTTVDMAAWELIEKGETVTVDAVLKYIESSKEWKHKINRDEFRPELVKSTLVGLCKLGFLDERKIQFE